MKIVRRYRTSEMVTAWEMNFAGNIVFRRALDDGKADLVLEFNKGDYVLLNHIGMPCKAMTQYEFNREFTVLPRGGAEDEQQESA